MEHLQGHQVHERHGAPLVDVNDASLSRACAQRGAASHRNPVAVHLGPVELFKKKLCLSDGLLTSLKVKPCLHSQYISKGPDTNFKRETQAAGGLIDQALMRSSGRAAARRRRRARPPARARAGVHTGRGGERHTPVPVRSHSPKEIPRPKPSDSLPQSQTTIHMPMAPCTQHTCLRPCLRRPVPGCGRTADCGPRRTLALL